MIVLKRKISSVKNIWIDEHHDTDWDGVPNYLDCVWYDSRKQDWKPSPSDIEWTRDVLDFVRVGHFWSTPSGIFKRTGKKEITLIRILPSGTEEGINRVKKVIKAMGWKFVDGR